MSHQASSSVQKLLEISYVHQSHADSLLFRVTCV